MNPDIAEAGMETRFTAGSEAAREAGIKGNQSKAAKKALREYARVLLNTSAPLKLDQLNEISDAYHTKKVTVQMASLFNIAKRALDGDMKALDYLIDAAGNPSDDIWDSFGGL